MRGISRFVHQLIDAVMPPPVWRLPLLIAGGVLVGLGLLTVYISHAFSYLSDDSLACINCHIMRPNYATWMKSSHGQITQCNDCHVPHDSIARKYYFKASDGARHSAVFTLRREPQVFEMKRAGVGVVQENCLRCHERNMGELILSRNAAGHFDRPCWDCHRETPHGRVKGISSVPNALVPKLTPALPDWVTDKFPGFVTRRNGRPGEPEE